MKKTLVILFLILFLQGCSLLPRLTMDTPNSVPQSIDKSKIKESCKGKIEWNEDGTIRSCSKGYVNYEEGYVKHERKMTLSEKIKSFINKLVGIGFWGLILIVIFVPGLTGVIIGRFVEGTIGITGKALKSVVAGVQQARKNGKDLNDALASEQDNDVKRHIRILKEKENIK